MNYTIRTDIKMAISSKGFIIAVAGTLIAVIVGAAGEIVGVFQSGTAMGIMPDFHTQAVLTSLSSKTFLFFVPILCALPYTTSVIDDVKSGYIKAYLFRTSGKRYIFSKSLSAGLSGGLVLFIGILLCFALFALVFTPMELASQPMDMGMQMDMPVEKGMESMGMPGQPSMVMEVVSKALMFFICGWFWSLIGLTFATATQSRYMAYAWPFVMYYVLIIISERYLKDIYIINPQEWLAPQNIWPGGAWGIALFVFELIVLASIAFHLACKRRLSFE